MELEMIKGCMTNSLKIDCEEEIDLCPETRQMHRMNICNWLRKHEVEISTSELVEFILETCGSWNLSDEPCPCCGDFIETYKLKI